MFEPLLDGGKHFLRVRRVQVVAEQVASFVKRLYFLQQISFFVRWRCISASECLTKLEEAGSEIRMPKCDARQGVAAYFGALHHHDRQFAGWSNFFFGRIAYARHVDFSCLRDLRSTT